MDRFVAMIWDQADANRQAQVNVWSECLRRQSPKWMRVLDAPGLRVISYHHRGDGPVVTPLVGQDGIVIGPLFARGEEKKGRMLHFDRREGERIVASRGDNLIKNYWGNYVAIWRDADKRRTTVLRDPCGAVPCLMTKQVGVDLLFAHAEDVADLPGLSFAIDWNFLQGFILYDYFITKHTGLMEVKELLAGERLECDPQRENAFSWAWNGARHAASPDLQSFDDARDELRSTAEACFSAWGTEYNHIVVSVSGGLDSAILVNLLRRTSDTRITAIHYVGLGYEEYEVTLARAAAAKAGIELIEVEQDPNKHDLTSILHAPRIARPSMQMMAVLIDELSKGVANRVGADCFVIGQGGDNLFLQSSGARNVLADYVRLQGFGKHFWSACYNSAILERSSVWKSLRDAIEANLLRKRWRPFTFLEREEASKFRPLTTDAISTIPDEYKLHPWFTEAGHLPPGKAGHLAFIVALYNYYVRHGRGIGSDIVYPYFSQPITEWALKTPVFVLAHDGVDRAAQRAAFADLVPESIVRRTSKGGANHYSVQVIEHNANFFRDMIMNGELRSRGWLDNSRVERMTRQDYAVSGGGQTFLKQIAAAEAWLQCWRRSRRMAA
jgi:asparagine synthase (glutamine-hydrolysing)